MAFWAKKSNLGDSQPSVNSELHQAPTGPVTSLQRDKCKHKFHCGAHAEEMRCVLCVWVCISLLCREERTRGHNVYRRSTARWTGVSITSHNNPLHTHTYTPSTCWWREPLTLIHQLHYPLRLGRTLNHSISPGEEGERRRQSFSNQFGHAHVLRHDQ